MPWCKSSRRPRRRLQPELRHWRQAQAQLDAAQRQHYDTQAAAAQSQLTAAQNQIDSGWSEGLMPARKS